MLLFFRTIFRTFKRNKSAFYINVLGLSSSLTCAILIFLWIAEEWHVDKFHVNGKRIYQIMQNIPLADGSISTSEHTPALLADALSASRPEIAETVSIKTPDNDGNTEGILSFNGRGIKSAELFVTPNFFKVFSFRLLEGNQHNLFPATNSIILSASTAKRLFQTTNNLIGRALKWDRGAGDAGIYNGIYQVAGIAADSPVHSSLKFEVLFPFNLYLKHNAEDLNWHNNDPQTYLLLRDKANIRQLNSAIENELKSRFINGSRAQQFTGTLFVQRFADRYLNNKYENGAIVGGRITYVKFFCGLALLILLIACINFTNLSTSQAAKRLKEIGVKKVLGISRGSLILQYLLESVTLSFLALLVSLLAVELLLPTFSSITGKDLVLDFNPLFTVLLITITLLTGIIAGIYPALYLSSLKPITALKGKLNINPTAVWTHKGLVAFQFTVSVVLIIAVLVVYQQMKLVQTQYLGYHKAQVLHFTNEGMRPETQQAFSAAVRGLPGVAGISNMEGNLLGNHGGGGKIDWAGKLAPIEFSGLYADYGFAETLGLQIVEGRTFSLAHATDTAGILFNETAIKMMGISDPVGKIVGFWGRPTKIIGVVKDFHFESLHKKVGPLFLSHRKNTANFIVRLIPGSEREALSALTKLYRGYNPGLSFDYRFLDQDFQKVYAPEHSVAALSRYFAILAMLLCCLGLFGLAAVTTEKRFKEIGIRKVLGATDWSVLFHLMKDLLTPILLSLFIAVPLAFLLCQNWLSSFAYRIGLQWWFFACAGLSSVLIAVITVAFQGYRAARTSPVISLKSE